MRGKFFSFRDGLQLPALWRWLLTLAGCLLTGLGLALACRLIDSQSLRQTLASLAQGSLWLTAPVFGPGLRCAHPAGPQPVCRQPHRRPGVGAAHLRQLF